MTARQDLKNVVFSVRQRLYNHSVRQGEDFGLTLSRYAVERLLYRLSKSQHAEGFVLKGAQLFSLWSDAPFRPTRDLDLLRIGDSAISKLEAIFREVCSMAVGQPDGIEFLPDSIRSESIREQAEYDGVRMKIGYALGQARGVLQIDIGFGDCVIPEPQVITYPSVLDLPPARLKAYSKESVAAEKFHALVFLGMANSRMKDFYDLYTLPRMFDFDGQTLQGAVKATFERRKTDVPRQVPLALTNVFAQDEAKQAQWKAFSNKNNLKMESDILNDVINAIASVVRHK